MIDFSSEVYFRTARSGGKGGQNVNKVETMVEAYWAFNDSIYFTHDQKQLIRERLANRINKEDLVMVKCQEARSQLANKNKALEKIISLVNQSIVKNKKRLKTKPSAAIIEKRLQIKKLQSEKKMLRRKDW